MYVKAFFFIFSCLYLVCAKAQVNESWANIAKKDLDYIYQAAKNNHPGYVDKENTYFKNWLEEGYKQGLENSEEASSLMDVMNTLRTYIAGFADGHFGMGFNYEPKYKEWAGMVMEKQGNGYFVQHVDSDWSTKLPEITSKLISCDDRSVEQIMAEDILTFRFNNQKLNFPKVRFAPSLFIDDGIGKRQQFKRCEFEIKGALRSFDIQWRKVTSDKLTIKTHKKAKARRFSFDEFEIKSYWVSLPTFNLKNLRQITEFKRTIEQVRSISPSADLIVLDLRGNGGGNSTRGVEVAKAIYGDEYIDTFRKQNPGKSYALWRASNENYEYISDKLLPRLEKDFGKESDSYRTFAGTSQRMKQAILNGKELVRQITQSNKETSNEYFDFSHKTQAKVIFLTDRRCASACLDFSDLLLKLPSVTHMGQETGADTVYMEVRMLDLPSGLARFTLAQKVYRNRLRKHNESYKPEFYFNGDISDTENVREWLLKQSENFGVINENIKN
mgnify:CR=1 FL=1